MNQPGPFTLFAASHRSGSTMITDLAKKLDKLGRPCEAFYPQNIAAILRKRGLDPNTGLRDWMPVTIQEGSSPNGAFAAKIFAENFRWLAASYTGRPWEQSIPALKGFFDEYFPAAKFIWIRRRDRLSQGISLLKALQTGVWHSHQLDSVKQRSAYYQRSKILWAMHNLEKQEADLQEYFKLLQVEPLQIWYEDFTTDLGAAMDRILAFADIPVSRPNIPAISLRKLGNQQTQEWINRFHRESAISVENPQKNLESTGHPIPIFSVNLHPLENKVLPGVPHETGYTIKNETSETIYFTGAPDGSGQLKVILSVFSSGSECRANRQELPMPFHLNPGSESSQIFNFEPPTTPGKFEIRLSVVQSGDRAIPITGKTVADVTVDRTIRDDLISIFGDFEYTAENWYYSRWFGYFYAAEFPWILSLDHGWLKFDEHQFQNDKVLVFEDFCLKTWQTTPCEYPVILSADNETLTYLETSNDVRLFRDSTGEIRRISTSRNDQS